MVYRLGMQHFLLVVNAANAAKDYAWMAGQLTDAGDVVLVDASSRYALLALQGPAAVETLQPLTGVSLADLPPRAFAHGEIAGVRGTIARTGYTGEDGFEIFVPPQSADRVWQAVLSSGQPLGIAPCGLGARDTLRLEAALRLYGSDIDETTTPLEAGLGWMVGWDKPAFNGRAELVEQKTAGVGRMLAGIEMVVPGVARAGHGVWVGDRKVGAVTSGTITPYLKKAIGMAYLPVDDAAPDTQIDVDIRGRRSRARVVSLPFYKRAPNP